MTKPIIERLQWSITYDPARMLYHAMAYDPLNEDETYLITLHDVDVPIGNPKHAKFAAMVHLMATWPEQPL